MTIRRATAEDLLDIVKMLADDPLGRTRETFSDSLPPNYLTAFERIDNDPNQELMVAEKDHEIVGTFQLSFIPSLTYQGGMRSQLEAVHIRRDLRGQGLGQKMVEWAISRAEEKQAGLMQLTTDKLRQEALKFYLNLGFKASHEGLKMIF